VTEEEIMVFEERKEETERQTERNKEKNICRQRKGNITNKKKINRGKTTKSSTERQKEEEKEADEVEGIKKIKRKDLYFAET
jgi:hypothetical protein